jgi:hypothetical protein
MVPANTVYRQQASIASLDATCKSSRFGGPGARKWKLPVQLLEALPGR